MTYKESFMKCKTLEELVNKIKDDVYAALFFSSQDRVKNIQEAANETIKEKGWDISDEKYNKLFGGE